MDENKKLTDDLVQISRLSLEGNTDDLRLFIARLVRRYRAQAPDLSARLLLALDESGPSAPANKPRAQARAVERKEPDEAVLPSSLSVLRAWSNLERTPPPVLAEEVRSKLTAIVDERRSIERLEGVGLSPISSAIFVGPPGVGKTQSAKWLSAQLGVPLFSLDLTAVMSSRLGQSGANLRFALDFARSQPSILFLDEVDSIAKRRADQSDIGELKRLVTIMLQELDDWPASSLLLAATNHPELVDPALWRRFDSVIDFPMPAGDEIDSAIERFLDVDAPIFENYKSVLSRVYAGKSYSDIERSVLSMRKGVALETVTPAEATAELVRTEVSDMTKAERIGLARELTTSSGISQHEIARMTTLSRDTIRKHTKPEEEGI